MKIRAIIVLALIACGIVSTIFYVKANQVSTNEKAIIEAIQTKNTPALIQALITRMKNQLEKDVNTFPELIKEVETYAGTCPDSASVAILHSMIAEMYNNYYMQNRWNVNQRTELAGYVPDDIREWTSNLFREKIKQELTLSLQPTRLLQQTPVSQYNLILKKGKDTPQLRPTLYDFLAFRAIDIQPSDKWYEDAIDFRRTQPEKKALLLDELDYWQYKYDSQSTNTNDYRNTLDSLYNVYGKEPFAAEIRIAEMNLLQRERYQGNKAHQDSIQALIYSLCKESIAQYPKYDRINVFKNQLNEMEMPVLNIQSDNNVYPGKDLTLQIKYVNTPQLVVRIYKSLRQPEDAWRNYGKNSKSMRGELVKEVTFKMNLANSYTEADSTLAIPMDRLGLYEYVITVPGKQLTVSNRFSVSRLAALTRSQTNNPEVLVTDLESGKPIERGNRHLLQNQHDERNHPTPGRSQNRLVGDRRPSCQKEDRTHTSGAPRRLLFHHHKYIPLRHFPLQTGKGDSRFVTLYGPGHLPAGTKRLLQRDRLCKRYEQPACCGWTLLYRHPAGCQL